MLSFKPDSLSYQLHCCPLFRGIDFSEAYLPAVIGSMNAYFEKATPYPAGLLSGGSVCPNFSVELEEFEGDPERDALMFYLLNHLMSVLSAKVHPYESLGEYAFIPKFYQEQLAFLSTRMFFYLLLICTRESRHIKNPSSDGIYSTIATKFGLPAKTFNAKIRGSGSTASAASLRNSPPDMKIGPYVKSLQYIFYHGNFTGGYGGKAWGKVTDCLVAYVTGKFSAEMMMDTAFTLCHNNGPIFNKGMLFEGYSHEIYKILDVQRSGQIPKMLANKETKHHSNSNLVAAVQALRKLFPGEFSGYVDWIKVKSLGALKDYSDLIEKQKMMEGGLKSPSGKKTKSLLDEVSLLKKAKFVAMLDKEAAHADMEVSYDEDEDDSFGGLSPLKASKQIEIMPDLFVTLTEIKR